MASIADENAPADAIVRPKSAVSTGVGLAGLAGLLTWFAIARAFGMSGPFSALTNLVACGLPMVLWSIFVDKVHRSPSTGIDWDRPLPPRAETLDISLTKLAGIWATWAIIGCIYALCRFYWSGNYVFAMECFKYAAPVLFLLSPIYIIWLDRRLIEPKDGAWAFGNWLMGQGSADSEAIAHHFRLWAVKGFYLAFMLSIVPGAFNAVVARPWAEVTSGPVALANYLITFMFVIDIALATVGYMLTMRPLDAHIRSATPYAAGWVAALICYPPFILMGPGGPLDYHPGTMGDQSWAYWLGDFQVLLWLWGGVLVVLTGIYAWATVAFGLRFSNLTHRGILTHGPYAFSKHPAYWSKNAFWWLSTLPFLVTTNSLTDAVRNTALLAVVSGVYWWRAKTEEWHLSDDPAYRAYAAWMAMRRKS